jgi:hypothetical protein
MRRDFSAGKAKHLRRLTMKSIKFVLFLSGIVLMLSLAACGSLPVGGAAEEEALTPVTAVTPLSPATLPPTSEPTLPPASADPTRPAQAEVTETPAAPPLSFAAATYQDDTAGFALDYPADWSIQPASLAGPRGSQALLLPPGKAAETLTGGDTHLALTIYIWEPQHDLAAFVAQRQAAWDGSGTTILAETPWSWGGDRQAISFVTQGPDGVQAFFLFTAVGENYLQISGEGDLALVAEMAYSLRPLHAQP